MFVLIPARVMRWLVIPSAPFAPSTLCSLHEITHSQRSLTPALGQALLPNHDLGPAQRRRDRFHLAPRPPPHYHAL